MRWTLLAVMILGVPPVSAEKGAVKIAVWDGRELVGEDRYSFSLTDGEGRDFSTWFKDGEAKLPFGAYTLKVDFPAHEEYNRSVLVGRPETQVLVHVKILDFATFSSDAPQTKIVGRILNAPIPPEQLWIRAISTSAEAGSRFDPYDCRPDSKGVFEIAVENYRFDYWLLIVRYEDGKQPEVLNAKYVSVGRHRDNHIEIDLGGR